MPSDEKAKHEAIKETIGGPRPPGPAARPREIKSPISHSVAVHSICRKKRPKALLGRFLRMITPRSRKLYRWSCRRLRRATGGSVASGPFAGMHYVHAGVCSSLHPKILGTYELELHGVVERLCDAKWDLIVNVGAAEGYYAVGMACRCPDAGVIAYEMDSQGRHLLAQLADLNGVAERIDIRNEATAPSIEKDLRTRGACLVIMDVEGAEWKLLDPVAIPSLHKSHVLVELHPETCPDISDSIRDRFATTHGIEQFQCEPRTGANLPVHIRDRVRFVLKCHWLRMMAEGRTSPTPWVLLTPRR